MSTETKSLEKPAKAPARAPSSTNAGPAAESRTSLAAAGNLAVQRLANPRLQRKPRVSVRGDASEEEADRVSQQVLSLISAPTVQCKCACGGEGECDECKRKVATQSGAVRRQTDELYVQRFSVEQNAPGPVGTTGAADAAAGTGYPATTATTPGASPGLIVEDNTTDLGSGQMKKSEFLGQLRGPVTGAAEAGLAGTMWSALGSVAVEPWFQYYARQSAQQLERTIQQSVPGSAGITNAGAYIPLVSARVQSAVAEWARTGNVAPGLPAGLPGLDIPGGGILGGIGSALSSLGSTISSGISSVTSSVGSGLSSLAQGASNMVSNIAGMLFKAKEGGARASDDPREIQAQLGGGEALEGSLQSRMSSAFGYDFSSVRVHRDNQAAQFSADLNARAFTIGSHVSFGASEYQPGTPVGDALIAHELAHVVQQGAASVQGPLQKGEAETNSLEDDADVSAVRAVASMWSGAKSGLAKIGRDAIPALKSGLKLQRCGKPAGGDKPFEAPYYDDPKNGWEKFLHGVDLRPTKAERVKEARDFFAVTPGLMIEGELVDADKLSDDEVLEKFRTYNEICRDITAGGLVACERVIPSVAMLGANGAQFTSKTLYQSEDFHIDVENPNPGQRPGQIHYQSGKDKYLYDPASRSFIGASKTLNKQLMNDPNILKAIERAMKMLGE